MAKLSRSISRGTLALMLLASLLWSASCGCSGGSASPPTPDYDHHYNHDGYTPGGYYPSGPHGDYLIGDNHERLVSRLGQYLERESRLTGASFIKESERSRVSMAATSGLEQFGQALYTPQAVDGWPALTDVTTTAYAIYAFDSGAFDPPAYLETNWAALPPDTGNLFIGVWRYAHERWLWTWYTADRSQRVQLDNLDDYRSLDGRETIYVTVLVSGSRQCALDSLALRQYQR